MTRQELTDRINEVESEIDNFELDPDDYEEQYKEMLDEYGVVQIGSLEYDASHVLECVDPTAYRCGLVDYVDGLDKTDDPRYQLLVKDRDELQEELDELEEEKG